jgi:hypothetical protein
MFGTEATSATAEVGLLPFARSALEVKTGGASTLPNSLQQAPVHAAVTSGHPVPDSVRGRNLSRGRGALEGTPGIAPAVGIEERARFHDAVPLSEASGGADPRPIGRHVPCPAPASSRAKAPAQKTVAEMGRGDRLSPAIAIGATRGQWNDCASLPSVVRTASEQTRIGLVLADAEFDSESDHAYIRQRLGAQSVIPARGGKKASECAARAPKCGGHFRARSIAAGL